METNEKMTKQIEVLRRNISLHKNIEKQLAKRAYKSQKIITGLKDQVEKLETQKQIMDQNLKGTKSKSGSKFGKNIGKGRMDADPTIDNLEGEELIDFLENKLEDFEKKLAKSQGDYEGLQKNCLDIQEKLGKSKEKYKRAALMLTEFLEDLLSQKPNIFREQMRAAGADEDDAELAKI